MLDPTPGLVVTLASRGNPDFNQDPRQPVPDVPSGTQRVYTLVEASFVCQTYIEVYDLGSGNWAGGVVTQDGVEVARISYNGKIWPAGADV